MSPPFTVDQVAGIDAPTSRQVPDRREAFRLLRTALSQGYGWDLLERDRDLDAIRDQPEFRQLVPAARTRRSGDPIGPASSDPTNEPMDPCPNDPAVSCSCYCDGTDSTTPYEYSNTD